MNRPRSIATAVAYFFRALRLRCPSCGERPMFIRWFKVRRLRDWFTPLDGCPRCGYPFERETGYFLMSIWAVNYGFSSILGLILYGILEFFFDLPIWTLMLSVLLPVLIFSVLFARHSKSLFLACDLFFDPHEKDGGDDDGNKLPPPPKTDGGAPASRPVTPCTPAGTVR
jgi:uncharacterized protein (DUF983 family)